MTETNNYNARMDRKGEERKHAKESNSSYHPLKGKRGTGRGRRRKKVSTGEQRRDASSREDGKKDETNVMTLLILNSPSPTSKQ